MSTFSRDALPRGIYTPIPTFFDKDEELELAAFSKHVTFIASAGTVPVLSGSMGEAIHLSHDERTILIRTCRRTLDDIGLTNVPIVAGVGAGSTRETIQLADEAAEAGADFVMVIPPGCYVGALCANNKIALKKFFIEVSAASRVPVVLYNFPAVSAGIDLDSEFILDVIKAAPNICGAKLTCVSVGKITRITAVAHTAEFTAKFPRKTRGTRFEVIDGLIDILLPSIAVGSAGAISGLPNFAPKVCVRLWELCQATTDADLLREAKRLQGIIALADGLLASTGVGGMKQILHRRFGHGKLPRRPLLPMSEEEADAVLAHEYLLKVLEEELLIV